MLLESHTAAIFVVSLQIIPLHLIYTSLVSLLYGSNNIVVYFKHITHSVVIVTLYKCMRYAIIAKLHYSVFTCCFYAVFIQSVAATTAVVAVLMCCWLSTYY